MKWYDRWFWFTAGVLLSLVLALALSGCVTGRDYSGCRRVAADARFDGWAVWECPHPFAVLGLTSDRNGYGAGSSWRNAFTDQTTHEVFYREGYRYLLNHEARHVAGEGSH
jgi:hypothetical protein